MELRWRTLIYCSGLCLCLLVSGASRAADPAPETTSGTHTEEKRATHSEEASIPRTQEGTQASAPVDPMVRRVREIAERAAHINAGEKARAQESVKRHQQRREELRTLTEKLTVALSLPHSSPEREEQVDQTYRALRGLVHRLRNDRTQAVTALGEVKSDQQQAMATLSAEGIGAAPALEQAVLAFQQAHEARVSAVQREIDDASSLLIDARGWQKTALEQASREAIEQARAQRLIEAREEVRSIPLDIQAAFKQIVDDWWKNPAELRQVQALGSLFLGVMQLALLLMLGIWTHGQIPLWAQRSLRSTLSGGRNNGTGWSSSRGFPSWIVSGDIAALAEPVGRFVQDLLVLTVSFVIMIWLKETVPLIAWISLVFLAGASVRIAQGLVELTVITPSETRPALRVTSEAIRNALMWIVRTFGMLGAILVVCNTLINDLLGAPHIASLLSDIIMAVGWIFVFVGLHRWGDALRERVLAGGGGSAIARWIGHSGTGRLTGIASAAAAAALLFVRWLLLLGQRIIDGKAGLSWIGAFLARRQLRDDGQSTHPPVSSETKSAIARGALQSLPLDVQTQQVEQAYRDWTKDRRRGLVAITGDRGCGKRVVLEQIADRTNEAGGTIKGTTPHDTSDEASALAWLGQVTGVQATASVESMVSALQQRPPTVFLISHLHRLFLRSVGRYDGLDAVLAVMQATGNTHFWIATIHGPSWTFLHGLAEVGNVAVFRTRVHIAPTSPQELQKWLESQTVDAGYQTRFDGLLPHPNRGGPDRPRRLERAASAYWRLLAESCQGNPSVAIRLWLDCLHTTTDEQSVGVSLFKTNNPEDIEHLQDNVLFTLTALILHDELSVAELHAALNMSESSVRATCRHLEQKGLIHENAARRYRVRLNWLPAVERLLRRRSFLHRS